MAQGGTFKSGFASGFAASFFSPGTSLGGDNAGGFTLRTTIAGVVGGTASEIGGGKFSNGAVSGAFVHMFNAEAHKYIKSLSIRQVTQVRKFMSSVKKMNLNTFNEKFNINGNNRMEMLMYKQNIYDQLKGYIVEGLYDNTYRSIEDIASPRSALAPLKAVYHLLGPSGELGYDFIENTTTLRGIYEIK